MTHETKTATGVAQNADSKTANHTARPYRIGLDVGISSLGWSVVEIAGPDDAMDTVVDMGCVLFTKAENPKNGKSLALPRRLKRSQRRIIARCRARVANIKHVCVQYLQVSTDILASAPPFNNMWDLRVQALESQITLTELAWVLVHLAKRRGYSHGSPSGTFQSKLLQEWHNNGNFTRPRLGKGGIPDTSKEPQRIFSITSIPNTKITSVKAQRLDVVKETKAILEHQATYHSCITPQFIKTITHFIEYQKYYASYEGLEALTGKCLYETTEKRQGKFTYLNHIYMLFERLANLTYTNGGQKSVLSRQYINKIMADLHNGQIYTAKKIEAFVGGSLAANKTEEVKFKLEKLFWVLENTNETWSIEPIEPQILDAIKAKNSSNQTQLQIEKYYTELFPNTPLPWNHDAKLATKGSAIKFEKKYDTEQGFTETENKQICMTHANWDTVFVKTHHMAQGVWVPITTQQLEKLIFNTPNHKKISTDEQETHTYTWSIKPQDIQKQLELTDCVVLEMSKSSFKKLEFSGDITKALAILGTTPKNLWECVVAGDWQSIHKINDILQNWHWCKNTPDITKHILPLLDSMANTPDTKQSEITKVIEATTLSGTGSLGKTVLQAFIQSYMENKPITDKYNTPLKQDTTTWHDHKQSIERPYLATEKTGGLAVLLQSLHIHDKNNPNPITNPVVRRSLYQLFLQLETIIKSRGGVKPDQIVVELARDVGKSFEDRQEIKKDQDARKEQWDAIGLEYQKLGGTYQNTNYPRKEQEKYALWKRQNGECLYTNSKIPPSAIINGFQGYEIDHIIPQSISFDDSLANKVLVTSQSNLDKGNQFAWDYMKSKNMEVWFTGYVHATKSLPRKTREYLLKPESEQIVEDFRSRNLHDTSYIGKYIAIYVKQYGLATHATDPVLTTNGRVTSFLRRELGMKKNRDNPIHHAIDAALIGLTTRKIYKVAHDQTVLKRNNKQTHKESRKYYTQYFASLKTHLETLQSAWQNTQTVLQQAFDSHKANPTQNALALDVKLPHTLRRFALDGELHKQTVYAKRWEAVFNNDTPDTNTCNKLDTFYANHIDTQPQVCGYLQHMFQGVPRKEVQHKETCSVKHTTMEHIATKVLDLWVSDTKPFVLGNSQEFATWVQNNWGFTQSYWGKKKGENFQYTNDQGKSIEGTDTVVDRDTKIKNAIQLQNHGHVAQASQVCLDVFTQAKKNKKGVVQPGKWDTAAIPIYVYDYNASKNNPENWQNYMASTIPEKFAAENFAMRLFPGDYFAFQKQNHWVIGEYVGWDIDGNRLSYTCLNVEELPKTVEGEKHILGATLDNGDYRFGIGSYQLYRIAVNRMGQAYLYTQPLKRKDLRYMDTEWVARQNTIQAKAKQAKQANKQFGSEKHNSHTLVANP
jgi:CRISPR/Cas system Type II protein with McrA/HNH and RuvC-like nuclease domain